MSRPLRISFDNAVYHLTARGNRREKIFYSDDDKRIFLQKMDQTFLKYSFLCYAYCLIKEIGDGLFFILKEDFILFKMNKS